MTDTASTSTMEDNASVASVSGHSVTSYQGTHQHVHRALDDENHHDSRSSAFRAPSTIPLNPSDIIGWSVMMEALLTHAGLWDLVRPLSDFEKATISSQSSSSTFASLGKKPSSSRSSEAHIILMLALRDSDTQRVLVGLPPGDPRALWDALQKRYALMPRAATAALYSQLLTLRQSGGESARAFADRIAVMRHQLATNGRRVDDLDAITVFINGVQSHLSMQVSSYYNLAPDPSFEQVVAVARGEETRLQLAGQNLGQHGSTSKGSANTVSNSAALGVDHSRSNGRGTCFGCGQSGHLVATCGKRNATPQEVAGGACPKPGHKHHKATACRGGAAPHDGSQGSGRVTAATVSSSVEAPRHVISLGRAEVSNTPVFHAGSQVRSTDRPPIVLDSGAGRTVIPSTGTLLGGQTADDVQITVANGQVLSSPLRGTAVIDGAGDLRLHVKDALQHDQIDRALLSVGSVLLDDSKVAEVSFRKDGAAAFTPTGEILFTASPHNGIFVLDTDVEQSRLVAAAFADRPPPSTIINVDAAASILSAEAVSVLAKLWHHRFCHRSYHGIRDLVRAKAVDGLDEVSISSSVEESHTRCVGCAQGKAHRQPFASRLDSSLDAQHVQARLHADIAGPLSSESLGGARYFLVLVDEWSEFGVVFFVRHKSDAADKIIDWTRQSRTRHGRELVEFHSDGGGEFVNEKLAKHFRQTGTQQTTTVAHTPQHNGKAERLIRTLTEWANAILTTAGAAKKFWAYAIGTVMYARNITQICKSSSDRTAKPTTPRSRWYGLGNPPSVSHMRVFGCDADVLYTVSPGLKLKKLAPKSRLCMFLGYDESKNDGWRFWDPSTRTVITSRDATFHEDRFTVSHAEREQEAAADDGDESEDDTDYFTRTTLDNETKLAKLISLEPSEASNQGARRTTLSASDNENSDTESVSNGAEIEPIVDSSDESDSGESPTSAPASSSSSSSKSKSKSFVREPYGMRDRSKIQPTHYYGKVNGNLAQARYVYIALAHTLVSGDDATKSPPAPHLGLPRNYAEAMLIPEWRDAILRENNSHKVNGTWEFVVLPPGCKAIGYKYVFRIKLQPDGTIERFKCRLTAQGFLQVFGFDYTETYAPVLCYHTLRLILALVAAEDYELHQMDVETAFLNATVEEDIYMRVPEGVDAPPGTVCKLKKALYGIKQAPHAWHAEIAHTLIVVLGYISSKLDPCLFTRPTMTGRQILFPLFVDDCFPACHTEDLAEMQADKTRLMAIYKIKDGGDATLLLGMRIRRDRTARTIHLDQQVYIERLLADYGATSAKPANTPQSADLENEPTEVESTDAERSSFATIVGSLQYAALSSRPDISYAVNSLARGLAAPTQAHRNAAWRVLRYLAGTPTLGITFGGSLSHRPLLAWSDANWAGRGGDNDGRSTSGWLVQIGTGPIAWSSKKQGMVALSSTESEYVAATLVLQQLIWIRGLLGDCGFIRPGEQARPTTLHCDNTAAIALTANQAKVSQRTKHINVRYHFIRECVANKVVQLKWVSTHDQIADILTKPLGPHIFLRLRGPLMGGEMHQPTGGAKVGSVSGREVD